MAVLEAKAPGVNQWCYGHIEGAVSVLGDVHAQLEDIEEHASRLRVGNDAVARVDTGDDALFVEHGQGGVDLLQLVLNLCLQVLIVLIGDAVCGTEDESLAVLIGYGPLLTDDEHRTHDE